MKTAHKRYVYTWVTVVGVFAASSVFFYLVGKFMRVPGDKFFEVSAFCSVAVAGTFKFILDFFDPLASVRTYASELCEGNLEDGNRRRKRDYKTLRIPSILFLGMGTILELFSLSQGR